MKTLALAAAAAMSLAPTLSMAQSACPANAVMQNGACACVSGYELGAGGACVPMAASQSATGGTATVPVMDTIPTGAIVVGGMVILAGVVIGIAAAGSDSSSGTTTTTTTTTTSP